MQKMTPEQLDGLLWRLNQGGCPVRRDHGYKIPPRGLAIAPIPGLNFSQIFDMEGEGAGYAVEVILRNELDRPLDVQGFQIKTPWGIPRVTLVPSPRKFSLSCPTYDFRGELIFFDPEFVLNPIFARQKTRLKPGEELEGVVLATSEDPIPEEIAHHSRTVLTLSVFDTRRNEYTGRFNVLVDKSARLRKLAKAREAASRPKSSRKRKLISPGQAGGR